MILSGVLLLAAPTARSQAYLQAMLANDLIPEQVLLLGDEEYTPRKESSGEREWQGLLLPNLAEPIAKTCLQAGINLTRCSVKDVNSAECATLLREAAVNLVIYSGFGGQLVSADTLNLGMPFLHVHSGDLPAYRGSTTLYYALLNKECPSVSAILLDQHIDRGPVLARRHYPPPLPSMDIDYVYDPAIRADLLVRVLRDYVTTDTLPILDVQQDERCAHTYYVIHPVLKHLAISSLMQAESTWKHA